LSTSPLQIISQCLLAEGLEHHGFARLERPFSFDLYQQWLSKGFAGEMSYLERHLEMKKEPQRLMGSARSAIVVTHPYLPHPESDGWSLAAAKVARYARGKDYHLWLKQRLEKVATDLRKRFVGEEFQCFTDSAPVLERDLAVRAGLGWIGKNTCLIDRRHGSLFLIGEIYTSLDLSVVGGRDFQAVSLPVADFCGNCRRCLDVCPTGALVEERELDARKCISYLTIESREIPDVSLRERMDGWFFGCDLCQTVCPWNLKVFGAEIANSEPADDRAGLIREMREILSAGSRELGRRFAGTPLERAGAFGLKRNALLVCAHFGLQELSAEVSALRTHPKLGPLADWVLTRL